VIIPDNVGGSELIKGVVSGVKSRLPQHVLKEKAEKGIN